MCYKNKYVEGLYYIDNTAVAATHQDLIVNFKALGFDYNIDANYSFKLNDING